MWGSLGNPRQKSGKIRKNPDGPERKQSGQATIPVRGHPIPSPLCPTDGPAVQKAAATYATSQTILYADDTLVWIEGTPTEVQAAVRKRKYIM